MFSILVANYNNGRFIKEAFESILAQTFTNWEVIIVDDGSEDDSINIIQPYLSDSRFKLYLNDKNYGCGYTKAKCIDLSNGSICGFLDPDDTLEISALQKMIFAHTEHPECSLVYSDHYICDATLSNKKISPYTGKIEIGFSYLVNPNRKVIHHFASFKKAFYSRGIRLDVTLQKAVDQDLYYKLEETGPSYYIPEPLYNYRIHDKGISTLNNINAAAVIHFRLRINAFARRKNNAVLNSFYPKDKSLFDYQFLRSRFYLDRYSGNMIKAIIRFPIMFLVKPEQFVKDYFLKR